MPKKGYKQKASHKKKIAKSVTGKSNGMYKDGRRSIDVLLAQKPTMEVLSITNLENAKVKRQILNPTSSS